MSILLYAYFFISIPLYSLIGVFIALVTIPFDPQRRILHFFISHWAAHYVRINPYWQLRICGREHILPHKTYILCANHLSASDILVLYGLHTHFKWIAKREAFWMPFLGWMMWLANYIPLRRRDPQSITNMMNKCRQQLFNGSSILIFPEGTRSKNEKINPFKHGAFTLACETNTPIIPIVIHGAFAALPTSKWLLNPQKRQTHIDVLPAIEANIEGKPATPQQLRALVRSRMLEVYARRSGCSINEIDGNSPSPKPTRKDPG